MTLRLDQGWATIFVHGPRRYEFLAGHISVKNANFKLRNSLSRA
jgi:hypothetical protein